MRKTLTLLILAMLLITPSGDKSLAATMPQPGPATQSEAKQIRPVWIMVGSANIRSGPSTQHQVIATAKWNDELSVIEEREQWYQVKLPGGQDGWVHRSLCSSKPLYSEQVKPKKPEPAPKPTPADELLLEVYLVDEEVKDSLELFYIYSKGDLTRVFGIIFNPDYSFSYNYPTIMRQLKERLDLNIDTQWHLYENLVRATDRTTAKHILFLFDNWEEWQMLHPDSKE